MLTPGTKTLWIDSYIDLNLNGQREFSALAFQTGISFKNQMRYSRELQFLLKELKCMDLKKDLAFIGACSSDKENIDTINHIHSKGGLVFGNTVCQSDLVDQLHMAIR